MGWPVGCSLEVASAPKTGRASGFSALYEKKQLIEAEKSWAFCKSCNRTRNQLAAMSLCQRRHVERGLAHFCQYLASDATPVLTTGKDLCACISLFLMVCFVDTCDLISIHIHMLITRKYGSLL